MFVVRNYEEPCFMNLVCCNIYVDFDYGREVGGRSRTFLVLLESDVKVEYGSLILEAGSNS